MYVYFRKSNNSVEFTLTTVKPKRGWLPWGPVLDRNTRYKSPGMPYTPLAYLEHKVVTFSIYPYSLQNWFCSLVCKPTGGQFKSCTAYLTLIDVHYALL